MPKANHIEIIFRFWKEINDRFNNVDYLTITPGAVITEKTKKIMNPPLSIEASQYSENIIKLTRKYLYSGINN